MKNINEKRRRSGLSHAEVVVVQVREPNVAPYVDLVEDVLVRQVLAEPSHLTE